MSCFLGTVQLQISSQNRSPRFNNFYSLKTKIIPGKRQRKWWLRSGSAAVWQQLELPTASINELALGQRHEAAPCSQQVTHEDSGYQKTHLDPKTSCASSLVAESTAADCTAFGGLLNN